MSRLSLLLTLSALSVSASAAVYVWRSRELSSLQEQLEFVRKSPAPPAPAPAAAVDHRSRFRALASLSPDALDAAALAHEVRHLSPDQLADWCQAALNDSMDEAARRHLLRILTGAIQELPDGRAANALLELSKSGKQELTRLLEKRAIAWTRNDPAAATAWLKPRLADGSLKHMRESFTGHMQKAADLIPTVLDPGPHLEKMRTAPEKEQEEYLRTAVNFVKTPEERRAITAAALTWPESRELSHSITDLMEAIVEADGFDAAMRWLKTVPDNGGGNIEDARVTLVLGKGTSPGAGDRANTALAQMDAAAVPGFTGRLIRQWVGQDHRAAGEWINAHPGTPWQNEARRVFASGIASADPEAALTWAGTITDVSLRDETAGPIYLEWRRNKPEAAEAFLRGSTLPDDLRQSLTGPLPEP